MCFWEHWDPIILVIFYIFLLYLESYVLISFLFSLFFYIYPHFKVFCVIFFYVTLARQIASFSQVNVWDPQQCPLFKEGNLRLKDSLLKVKAQYQNELS